MNKETSSKVNEVEAESTAISPQAQQGDTLAAVQAVDYDESTIGKLVELRRELIREAIAGGLSPTSAGNLIDFLWIRRGWPVIAEEQLQNIQRWSLN